MSDSEHFDEFLPCELIIVTEKYLIPDVKYIADMYGKFPIIAIDESLPIDKGSLIIAKEYFPQDRELKKSRCIIDGREVIFCGKSLEYTKTQLLIIRMFVLSDKKYTAEMIAAYCMKEGRKQKNTAVSHIHDINLISRKMTGFDLIECKRYIGYYLKMI